MVSNVKSLNALANSKRSPWFEWQIGEKPLRHGVMLPERQLVIVDSVTFRTLKRLNSVKQHEFYSSRASNDTTSSGRQRSRTPSTTNLPPATHFHIVRDSVE